jgi:hypothetical protein
MVAAQFGDWPALITRQRSRRKPGLILLSHSAESTDVEMPHPRLQAGSSTSATPKRSGRKAAVQSSHQLSAQVYAIHNFYPTFADEIVSRGAARKGLTWHYCRPPVIDIEYQIGCRGVSIERVISVRFERNGPLGP